MADNPSGRRCLPPLQVGARAEHPYSSEVQQQGRCSTCGCATAGTSPDKAPIRPGAALTAALTATWRRCAWPVTDAVAHIPP